MAIDVTTVHNLARSSRDPALESGPLPPCQASNLSVAIVLVATPAICRASIWTKLGPDTTVESYGHKEFAPDRQLADGRTILIYQIGPRVAQAGRLLAQLAEAQCEVPVILIGRPIRPDHVAALLRDGALDYLTWPCPVARLQEAIERGATYRRTVRQVQQLSAEAPRVAQDLTHTRSALQEYDRKLVVLHHLVVAFAGARDEDEIIKALIAGLPDLMDIDMIGVARSTRNRDWVWVKSRSREWEARVRRYLGRRLGYLPSDAPQPLSHLRLVSPSRPRPVPSLASQQGEDPTIGQEIALSIGPEESVILIVHAKGSDGLTQREQEFLETVGAALSLSWRKIGADQRTQDDVLRDPLTAILNKSAIDEAVARELRVGQRYRVPACLLVLDLDYFTTVNDRLGHTDGDQVLKAVADLIRNTVRDVDIVGRYGGNRFAVMLPHTDRLQTHLLAERLRRRIEQHLFTTGVGQVRTTASLGLAAVPDPSVISPGEWIRAANAALSEAKAQGRNCVVVHAPKPPALACTAVLSLAA